MAKRLSKVLAVLLALVALGSVALAIYFVAFWDRGADVVYACVPSRIVPGEPIENAITCPPKNATYSEGYLRKDSKNHIELETLDGETKKITVRDEDRKYFDIDHAMSHARNNQAVRVFTKKVRGEEIVIYIQDSPSIPIDQRGSHL